MAGYLVPLLVAARVMQHRSYAPGDIITGVVRRDVPGGADSGGPCIVRLAVFPPPRRAQAPPPAVSALQCRPRPLSCVTREGVRSVSPRMRPCSGVRLLAGWGYKLLAWSHVDVITALLHLEQQFMPSCFLSSGRPRPPIHAAHIRHPYWSLENTCRPPRLSSLINEEYTSTVAYLGEVALDNSAI